MKTRRCLPMLIVFVFFGCVAPNETVAQSSLAQFQKLLTEKASFNTDELSQLQQGQTVVKAFPTEDQREVAVCGAVRLNVDAREFLRSFREVMVRKSNPAILEIGRFSDTPSLDDLGTLTVESRDLDDLKDCSVGRCAVKLSSAMIQRFQKEVDWQAADYKLQASNLFKRILVGYVNDYLARGESALINYADKLDPVQVAKEQRALLAAGIYSPDKFASESQWRPVESLIVWSKMNFGLKPVISINQLTFYTREAESGPLVLIASKQLYANHYFDSSVALTTFLRTPDGGSYLVYENRSLADGLGGFFGKMKRDIVETKAMNGLRGVLEHSRANLNARTAFEAKSESAAGSKIWKWLKLGSAGLALGFILITGFTALFAFGSYSPKSNLSR